MAHTNDRAGPTTPLTLAIDIGGSHLKAAVLNASGKLSTDPVRVKTPKPATPDAVVAALISLSQQLGQFDRVSIGFPGECVLTMGTGMGFALFQDGQIAPHLELSQHPIRKRKTYDEYVGEVALETVGRWRWTKRVRNIIGILETVITYDTLYIGGGNAELIEPPLPANVKIVSNTAGITGGVRLWDGRMDHAFAELNLPAFSVPRN